MEPSYYFFFSYASNNHLNAKLQSHGRSWNYLDELYDTLCRQVSDITGESKDKVAFRDDNRLKTGDIWSNELVQGLRKSRVLLALISPHYLQSNYCGIELSFFHKRIQEFVKQANIEQQIPYILPLFWEDSSICFRNVSIGIKNFFERLHFTQKGMPTNYPVLGLSQICRLGQDHSFQQICRCVAERIVELAESPHILPELPEINDFNGLESLYTELIREDEQNNIQVRLSGLNVVYFVGSRSEMEAVDNIPLDNYKEECENWIPFPESSDETVEQLTCEGAKAAGIDNLNNIGFPENFIPLLDTAKQRNSLVLIVLDRSALTLTKFQTQIAEYAQRIYPNCGLVTAGGKNIPDEQVKKAFGYVFLHNFPNHFWEVPTNKENYIPSVSQALQGIKRQIMVTGEPTLEFTTSKIIPGLHGPSRY